MVQRQTITLIEEHYIKANAPHFRAIDTAAFAVENLYNKSLYPVRQAVNPQGYTSATIWEESSFMKKKLPTLWTRSRFVSTVGAVSLEVVKQYVQEQQGK
jgi:hypothetical protein